MAESAPPAPSSSPSESSTSAPASQVPPPRKRRGFFSRVLRGCFWLAIVLGTTAYFLPQIVSIAVRSPFAKDWLQEQTGAVIDIGEAPLEWGRPIALKNVVVKSLDGRPLATAASVQTRRSFWEMLFGDPGILDLELQGIHLSVRIPEPSLPTGKIEISPVIAAVQKLDLPLPPQPVRLAAGDVTIDFLGGDGTVIETWHDLSLSYAYVKEGKASQTVTVTLPRSAEHLHQGAATLQGTWVRDDGETFAFSGDLQQVSLRPFAAWVDRLVGPDNRSDHAGGSLQGTLTRRSDRSLTTLLHARLLAPAGPGDHLPAPGAVDPQFSTLLETGFDAAYDDVAKVLAITQMSAVAQGAQIHAQGRISGIFAEENIDLSGQVELPEHMLVSLLDPQVRDQVELDGLRLTQFAIQGPLHPLDDGTSLLNVGVTLDWKKAAAFGLASDDGVVRLRLTDGLLVAEPIRLIVNDGRIAQLPQADLRTRPVTLTFQEGPLLENMLLSEQVCRGWMKYIAPSLANAVSTDGRFSIHSRPGFLPINESGGGKLAGTLTIARAQVRPGPLANQFLGVVNLVQSLIPGLNVGDFSRQPLLTIQDEVVNYRLENGRVYHDKFGFSINKVRLSTTGSVGLDETLDLVLSVNLPPEWFAQRGPLLKLLAEEKIQLRVAGTLDAPVIDTSPLRGFGQRIGVRAGAGLLERFLGVEQSK